MMRSLSGPDDMSGAELRIAEAPFPAPFMPGLEFSPPARGVWNIVHTGMLIPESHQIFVCARGCLRGVILTAAEMNAMDRMSWVALEETDLFDGRLESGIIEGTDHILRGLSRRPPCVLIFISCIQQFAGLDFAYVLNVLRERFPGVDFVDCYMNPTMRKSGPTPDQIMRRQLYAPLKKPGKTDPRAVALLGNDLSTDPESEFVSLIRKSGFDLRDITLCRTYEEYKRIAECSLFLTTMPGAVHGAECLSARLDVPLLDLPQVWSFEGIRRNLSSLAGHLGIPEPDTSSPEEQAEAALRILRTELGDIPVAIDYTAVPYPLSLARLLLDHGIRVIRIYADAFQEGERQDFEYLQRAFPELLISSAVHVKMRFAPGRAGEKPEKHSSILAVGQKAAWFCDTRHFVNLVSGGGLSGFRGIIRLTEEMRNALREEKNTEEVIRRKGFGCESCLS